MNYYKQGDAAKADKIKAAFEKLGYKTDGWKFNTDSLYYTTEEKRIDLVCSKFLINLIKTHQDYQELELPVEHKFKAGDWLVYEDGNTFAGGSKSVQVKAVEGDRYIFTHNTGGFCRFIDRNCRLWTIEDAKDGDVLVTTKVRSCPFIYRKTSSNNGLAYYYAGIDGNGNFREGCIKRTLSHFCPIAEVAPATKEQRDLLFKKMEEAGYKWDADKKELRKIKSHYNISDFKAGMPVLVRILDEHKWCYLLFSHCYKRQGILHFHAGGAGWLQCIPFNKDTEHLLGTTDMPSEEYINW